MAVDTSMYRYQPPQANQLSDVWKPLSGQDIIGAMQAKEKMNLLQTQNRLVFMEEQQKIADKKSEDARRAALVSIGVPDEQANAVAQQSAPPPPANALSAPAPVPSVPENLPAPLQAPGPIQTQGYQPPAISGPTSFGQNADVLKQQRDDAMKTFDPVFKAVVTAGDQGAMDALLRAAKKNPALAPMVNWVGDPDGPESRRLKITGKGESETTSEFSQEQLNHIATKAATPEIEDKINSAPPGSYEVKSKGGKIVGFDKDPDVAWGQYTASMQRAEMMRGIAKRQEDLVKEKIENAKKITEINTQLGVDFWNNDPVLSRFGKATIEGNGDTREVKAGGKVIGYDVRTADGKRHFEAAKGQEPVSDIGKLISDRDKAFESKVAAGMSREDALKDPDVKAYNDEIKKKAEPKEGASKDKYLLIKTRILSNDPTVTQEEKHYAAAYEKEKILGPEAYGRMRLQMILVSPVGAYDTNNGSVGFKTKEEINKGDAENEAKGLPPRYVPAELAQKLKSRNAIFEEIAQSSEIARKALNSLKKDKFSQTQLLKFADQLRVDDGGSVLRSLLDSNLAKTLSPEEREYITAVRNLRESSFSLRTIGGMGQGSDMLRAAISEMLPGPRTPDKAMGNSAMDKFDIQVDSLWSGLPGVGAEGTTRRKKETDAIKAKGPATSTPQRRASDKVKPEIAIAGTVAYNAKGEKKISDGKGGWN